MIRCITRFRDCLVRISKKGLTPREIALGVAVGIFVAFIPFVGTHTLTAVALASLLRVNTLIVLLGTQISNPLTLPFQLFLSAEVGSLLLKGKFLEITFSGEFITLLGHYIAPIIVGGFVLGIICSIFSFLLVRGLLTRYR